MGKILLYLSDDMEEYLKENFSKNKSRFVDALIYNASTNGVPTDVLSRMMNTSIYKIESFSDTKNSKSSSKPKTATKKKTSPKSSDKSSDISSDIKSSVIIDEQPSNLPQNDVLTTSVEHSSTEELKAEFEPNTASEDNNDEISVNLDLLSAGLSGFGM